MSPRNDRTARRSLVAAGSLLIALATLAGCSGGDDTTISVTETPNETEATAAPSGDVLAPSTFEGQATSVTGETVELAALADKDLVLWFWAPW